MTEKVIEKAVQMKTKILGVALVTKVTKQVTKVAIKSYQGYLTDDSG